MGKLKEITPYVRRRVVSPSLKKARRLLLGNDFAKIARQTSELSARVNDLMQKVDRLTRSLDLLIDSPQNHWLYKNRLHRMDATVEMFDAGRRQFHLARYQFAASHVSECVVADIACGTGYGAALLLREGNARRVIGVDIDPQTIQYARATHGPPGVDYLCASGDTTGMETESVDAVVSFETIEHVPDDAALLAEFHRIIRLGGRLIISTPNDWLLEAAPHHVRAYDRSSFENVLSTHFANIRLFNQNSGCASTFNHGRPAGIQPTKPDNETTAECYIAICDKRIA